VHAATLMEETLEHIENVNPIVNAIVGLRDRTSLIAEAHHADQSGPQGSLHGLPVAVKDLVNVAGVTSTQGSPLFRDFVPDHDDVLAARLRAAGAILIGKTNTPEFGLGSHTFNSVYGVTRNPYNLALSCGGSSGGAAVALATGMLSLADGSDMMGSLRNPAGWNNVYGFRPSWGLIPNQPKADSFLHQLSTLGAMARSPQDIAILLKELVYSDPYQPHCLHDVNVTLIDDISLDGLRLAWLGNWNEAFPMEEGILSVCEHSISVLQEAGAIIETPVPPFDAERLFQSWITLRSWQIVADLGSPEIKVGALKDTAIWEIEKGRALSALDVHYASCVRSEWFRTVSMMLDTYDAFLLPTAQVWPFSTDIEYPVEIAGVAMDTYHRWMHVMVPASLAGLPVLAMPAGFSRAGLPIGLQLIGRRGFDARLLSIGVAYDAITGWVITRPPLQNS